jgi:hypothetical protein
MLFKDLEDVEFAGIDHSDYPDYSDAYIESANIDGVACTDGQLDSIATNDGTSFYMALMDYLM